MEIEEAQKKEHVTTYLCGDITIYLNLFEELAFDVASLSSPPCISILDNLHAGDQEDDFNTVKGKGEKQRT